MALTPLQREYGIHLTDELLAGRMTRRELLVRATVFGLGMPTIVALLEACGGSSPTTSGSSGGTPKNGGTIRVAVTPPTAALDPLTLQDDGSFTTLQQVYEYLAWVQNDGSITPVLALSWSPDSSLKQWTFKLRSGVKFSSGQAFTAADVVASFARLADPKNNSNALPYFQGLLNPGDIQKVDDQTVVFNLQRGFADFPYYVSSANYNAFIIPATYQGDLQHPIGTGPFLMTSYEAKQGATFKKNPNYWRANLPYLDGVSIQYLSDNQAQVLQLLAGNIDMMNTTPYQGSQSVFGDPDISVLQAKSSTWREFHMRVDMDPFKDKRVRQAIALTLDRELIRRLLFNGAGDLGEDHLFAPSFGYAVTMPQRKQDYAMAKSLLTAAGHPNGIQITLTTEDFLEMSQLATVVKQMAAPAGIDITLNVEPQGTYYGSGNNQPWLVVPFGCVDWSARAVPSQLNSTCAVCNGIWNNSQWCDQNFTNLTHQFDATVDHGGRVTLANQMAQIIQDATPMLVPYWIAVQRAVRKNVHGVTASGYDYLDLAAAWLS